MPRTDENGRQLKTLLDYLLDGDIEDAEELRLVASRFGLSYPDLQVRFGLMSREELQQYIESSPFTVATINTVTATRIPVKLSELKPRLDAPSL